MTSTDLFNWTPVVHVMVMGALVALGPLCWVWLRNRQASTPHRVRMLTLVTLFLTFDLVLFGAFTRLTDSGLGCPDWPGCYGHASPVGAQEHIAQAQAAMPTGPVTHTKAWIEMIHRYLATGVGVLILTLALFAWRQPGMDRLLPTLTLLWVCVQGLFGAWTVTLKLQPAIVSLHLLGGLLLLALLSAQVVQHKQGTGVQHKLPVPATLRVWLGLALLLVWLQAALGAWVSTNYAVLACDQFPQCQDSWWPAMDFASGFELWRPLGFNGQGQAIPFEALTAIHYTHRLGAYGVTVVLLVLIVQLRAQRLGARSAALAALLLLQCVTGITNVVAGWPLGVAVLHTGGAAALVTLLTAWWVGTTSSSAEAVHLHGSWKSP